jgi:site-specific DNA-methyltransferase (adenine-specific)
MANLKACFSSKSDEWSTPQNVFNELDKEFHFTLDPCATDDNHKCDKYFTLENDGLSENWGGYRVFCNPPYSEIDKWVEKAYRETRNDNTLVVLLIPSRTDTRYFHNYIYQRAEIRFVKGRLKFGDGKGSAPFPSMIVIFRGANLKGE